MYIIYVCSIIIEAKIIDQIMLHELVLRPFHTRTKAVMTENDSANSVSMHYCMYMYVRTQITAYT